MRFGWLITGAQGFVGRYVCDYLLRAASEARVVGIGRSVQLAGRFSHSISGPQGPVPAPLPDELSDAALHQDRYRYCRADVTSSAAIQAVLEEFRPDRILHLASGLRGDRRKDLLEINVEGTASLLEAIGRVKNYSPTVVMGSSGGVYGRAAPEKLPLSENVACEPADEYSVTKLTAELMARLWAGRLGIRLIIARIFNIVGAGQDERHVAGQIARQLCMVRSGASRTLQLGHLDCTRDFIDVRDVAQALTALAQDDGAEGIFNVGSGVECAIGELLRNFLAAAGIQVAIDENQDIQPGVPRNYADTTRLRQIGFTPAYSLRDSVDAVWSHYERLWSVRIPRTALATS